MLGPVPLRQSWTPSPKAPWAPARSQLGRPTLGQTEKKIPLWAGISALGMTGLGAVATYHLVKFMVRGYQNTNFKHVIQYEPHTTVLKPSELFVRSYSEFVWYGLGALFSLFGTAFVGGVAIKSISQAIQDRDTSAGA